MCALCETTETTPQKRKENEKMKQMKKWIALLLALVLVLTMAACQKKPAEIQEVTYYCSIGAYLSTLQEEINK